LNALSFEQVAIKVAGSVENFYSRDHLRTKIKAGEFPRPIYLSRKKQVWVEAEIDRYLTKLAAKRELRGAK
jgi:predicted DNA-binding transcriptional regulator AlpA